MRQLWVKIINGRQPDKKNECPWRQGENLGQRQSMEDNPIKNKMIHLQRQGENLEQKQEDSSLATRKQPWIKIINERQLDKSQGDNETTLHKNK